MIRQHLQFLDMPDSSIIGYALKEHANNDSWKNILVLLNGGSQPQKVTLPSGDWILAANEEGVQEKGIGSKQKGTLLVAATAAYVLYQR